MSTITNLSSSDNGADSLTKINNNFSTLNTDKLEASNIAGLFDKSADDLDDITEGTTNKHYSATEKTKLSGIEENATADQTGAEIKAAYEGEADTNAYTDAEKSKLAGIEAGADVTDAANVTAAGALMDSEVTNLADVKAFDPADYAPALGADDNYVTDAEKAVIGNTSGTNTGDQDLSGLTTKATLTTKGDIYVATANATPARLGVGTNGQALIADSTEATGVKWGTASAGAVEGTAVLSTGETGGTKFLRENGDGTCSWQTPTDAGDVSKVGTPADNQVGVWTGDGTIEGSAGLTYASNALSVSPSSVTAEVEIGQHAKIESKINADTEESCTLTSDKSVDIQLGASGYFNVFNTTPESVFYVDTSGNVRMTGDINVGNKLAHFLDTDTHISLEDDKITLVAGGATAITITEGATDTIEVGAYDTTFANKIQAPTIELGHASDTTIARASAGVVSIEGNNIITTADVDDTPVNGVTTAPVSSNWAYDHAALASSDTVAGHIELATTAETTTGTATDRAVTPDGLAGSDYGKRVIQIQVADPAGDAITTGDGKAYFFISSELNGYNLVDADACVTTVSSSGAPTVQVRNVTDSQDMLSTAITIDANEKTSYTAATAPVINTSYDDVATGDEIAIDIDGAGTGAKGLTVILTFQKP